MLRLGWNLLIYLPIHQVNKSIIQLYNIILPVHRTTSPARANLKPHPYTPHSAKEFCPNYLRTNNFGLKCDQCVHAMPWCWWGRAGEAALAREASVGSGAVQCSGRKDVVMTSIRRLKIILLLNPARRHEGRERETAVCSGLYASHCRPI